MRQNLLIGEGFRIVSNQYASIGFMRGMLDDFRKISNRWFFGDTPWYGKLAFVFIKGDTIVLLPFFMVLLCMSFWKLNWSALMFAIFIALRGLGEMVYWIHQQFGDRKYRPNDFGFTNLDNNAIYILYQLIALLMASVGVFGTVLVLNNGV